MSGPWEDFKKPSSGPADADGPWNDFKSKADESVPSEGQSALRGGISGVVAGFDDEFTGAVGAAGRLVGIKNLGSFKPFDPNSKLEMASTPLSMDEIANAYRENRDAIRDEQRLDMETNPKATLAGNVAGAIISPVSKIRVGQAIGPMTKSGTLVHGMKTAALQGGAFGAGTSQADLTKGEVGQFVGDVALSAGIGAAIPPALEGAKQGIKKGAQVAGWTGKKVFNGVLGLSGKNVEKYLANPDRINKAKSIGELKDLVDESVGKLREAVEQGKATETEAKEGLRALREQVTRGLSDKRVDSKDALRLAENAFSGARERVLAPLKSTPAPTSRAADASAMVGELKQKIRGMSGKALETLKDSGSEVDLSRVYSQIDDSVARLKGSGTDEALSIAGKLEDYKVRLMAQSGPKAGASSVKKLIQGIDEITEYSPMAGSFDKAKNSAFKGIRSELDQAVKETVPEYRQQMSELAPQAKLLDEANSAFGAPEMAVGRLGRLNTPRGEFDRSTLGRLEDAVGKGGLITKEADAYAVAQKILKDPQAVRKIEQGLPEYQTLRQAMADVAKRNPKWTRAQVEQATAKQRKDLAIAVNKRITSENKLAPFKGITPGSSENKLRAAMRSGDRGMENKAVLKRLSEETGIDFLQATDDLAIKESFESARINGSRNTLFWGIIGFATGGIPGALAGGTFGHQVIDRYGPKVGKALLDGMIKLKKSPSMETIRSLNVPAPVKAELEREFRVYMITKNALETRIPRKVAEEQPKKGEDRWAQRGVEKLGIKDPSLAEQLMQSKEGKRLLIEASDLPQGSKKLESILNQISKGWGNKYGNEPSAAPEATILRQQRRPSSGR